MTIFITYHTPNNLRIYGILLRIWTNPT